MRLRPIIRHVPGSIKVVFDQKKHFGIRDLTHKLKWLKDLGDQPLDVHIRVPPNVNLKDSSPFVGLRWCVSRFQRLCIRAPKHETADTLVNLIGEGTAAPLLERLDILVEKESSKPSPVFTPNPNAFYPCPRLKHLTIPGFPLPSFNSPHFINLTSLTINAVPFHYDDMYLNNTNRILDILDSTKNLHHFTYVDQDVSNRLRLTKSRTISMPHLLSVDVSVPGCGLDILCVLDAPFLTNVRFDGWRNKKFTENWNKSLTEPMISASLRQLSERSPNLTHLELRCTVMHNPHDDYLWLMSDDATSSTTGSAFPRLEVLRLYATDITDKFLRFGAGKMVSLKRLELLACMGVSGKGILKFVEGRNRDFELLIEACPGVTQEDLEKLAEIVNVL